MSHFQNQSVVGVIVKTLKREREVKRVVENETEKKKENSSLLEETEKVWREIESRQ